MFDPLNWMPWALAAHLITVSIPFGGALSAIVARNAMFTRLHFDDPDNPMLEPSPWGMGARRRKAQLVWLYMTIHGADANALAYVGGQVSLPIPPTRISMQDQAHSYRRFRPFFGGRSSMWVGEPHTAALSDCLRLQ